MKFSIFSIAAAAALVALPVKADFYANFFNDANCRVGGGIGVNIQNDGCLTQTGRRSVLIPNTGIIGPLNQYCLVSTYADGQCSCQSAHYDFTATGFCHELDPNVKSYRFIHEACGPENC